MPIVSPEIPCGQLNLEEVPEAPLVLPLPTAELELHVPAHAVTFAVSVFIARMQWLLLSTMSIVVVTFGKKRRAGYPRLNAALVPMACIMPEPRPAPPPATVMTVLLAGSAVRISCEPLSAMYKRPEVGCTARPRGVKKVAEVPTPSCHPDDRLPVTVRTLPGGSVVAVAVGVGVAVGDCDGGAQASSVALPTAPRPRLRPLP